MNGLTVGVLIVLFGLALQAISGSPARAAEKEAAAGPGESTRTSLQGTRVLGLVVALRALQATPAAALRSKV